MAIKIKLDTVLKTVAGDPMREPKTPGEPQSAAEIAALFDLWEPGMSYWDVATQMDFAREVTIRDVLISALINAPQKDVKSREKFERGRLAFRLREREGEMELLLEEAVMLKELVGEMFTPVIVYQVWNILEAED